MTLLMKEFQRKKYCQTESGKEGIKLKSLNRNITNEGIQYDTVKAEINRGSRINNIHIIGPTAEDVIILLMCKELK